MEMAIISLFGAIIWGVIWGKVTQKVVYDRGYKDDWFWYGFFLGIIALILALLKPDISTKSSGDSELDNLKKIKEYKELLDSGVISQEEFDRKKNQLMKPEGGLKTGGGLNYTSLTNNPPPANNKGGTWTCPDCGKVNPLTQRVCKDCGHEK